MKLPKSIKPKRAIKLNVDKVKTVKRLVHYYELLVGYKAKFKPSTKYPFIDLLQKIVNDIQNGVIEQHVFDDKTFFIPDIEYDPKEDIYQGRLFTVRSEDFPQLINKKTKELKDIEAGVDDGLVEASHFIINCKTQYPEVAYEYNAQGGRINDLLRCLNYSGMRHDITEGISNRKIVNEDYDSFIRRMGRLSRMTVKVHRDNLSIVNNVSEKIASGVEKVINEFDGDYGQIEVKFNYKQRPKSSKMANVITDVIKSFKKNPLNQRAFDTFVVEAEDHEDRDRLHAFDLLLERLRSEIRVERKEKSRTINSNNMFQLMKEELQKTGLNKKRDVQEN